MAKMSHTPKIRSAGAKRKSDVGVDISRMRVVNGEFMMEERTAYDALDESIRVPEAGRKSDNFGPAK